MGTILKNGIAYGASNQPTAAAVPYSNTSSGLTATNVQAAVDTLGKITLGNGTATSLVASVEASRWMKTGRLCTVYFMFIVNGSVANTDVRFTGLPKPKEYIRLAGMRVNTSQAVRVAIQTDGTLRNAYDLILSNSDTNKQIQVAGTYVIADSEL